MKKKSGLIQIPPKMLREMEKWVLQSLCAFYLKDAEKTYKALERSSRDLKDLDDFRKDMEEFEEESLEDFIGHVRYIVDSVETISFAMSAYLGFDLVEDLGEISEKDVKFFNSQEFKELDPRFQRRRRHRFESKVQDTLDSLYQAVGVRASGSSNFQSAKKMHERNLRFLKKYAGSYFEKMRKFDVNLEGWKYGKGRKKIPTYSDIKIEIRVKETLTPENAWWSPSDQKIVLLVFDYDTVQKSMEREIKETLKNLKHEAVHMAQAFLKVLSGSESAGLPSKKPRSQGYLQQGAANPRQLLEMKRRLEGQGLTLNDVDVHSLDDVEFYTKLMDSVGRFLEMLDPSENLNSQIRSFVRMDSFFRDLKRVPDQKTKMKKALKILYTAARKN